MKPLKKYDKKKLKLLLLRLKNQTKALEYHITSGHRRSQIGNTIGELKRRLDKFEDEAYQWATYDK